MRSCVRAEPLALVAWCSLPVPQHMGITVSLVLFIVYSYLSLHNHGGIFPDRAVSLIGALQ